MYVESRKWYSWSYLQSRNRDTDVENISIFSMDTKGAKGVGGTRRLVLTYTHYNLSIK